MVQTSKFPANTSHTVLVHAGSYKDFLNKLNTNYPQLHIRFAKKIAIHYFIVQIEDVGTNEIPKQKIYELPIMALREEFSNYIFFKNVKSYNNVLKRMCNASEDPNAAYVLLQHMMTPLEKGKLLDVEKASKLEIVEENERHETVYTTYFVQKTETMALFNKLFPASEVKIDGVEKKFVDLIKTQNWKVGIC